MKTLLIIFVVFASGLLNGQSRDSIKARAIFDWITKNIEYDVEAYQSNRVGWKQCDPKEVLKTKKAVCQGYAELFQKIAQDSGLECKVIVGKAKTFGFGNHAWNAVKVDSVWRLVDACWGAGGYSGDKFIRSYKPYYFFTPPEKMIEDHYPLLVENQLLSKPVTEKEFFGEDNDVYQPVMYTLLLAEEKEYSRAELLATQVVTGFGRAVITYDPGSRLYLVYSGEFTSEKDAIAASKTVDNSRVKKLTK